jgi:hypothetical protein
MTEELPNLRSSTASSITTDSCSGGVLARRSWRSLVLSTRRSISAAGARLAGHSCSMARV